MREKKDNRGMNPSLFVEDEDGVTYTFNEVADLVDRSREWVRIRYHRGLNLPDMIALVENKKNKQGEHSNRNKNDGVNTAADSVKKEEAKLNATGKREYTKKEFENFYIVIGSDACNIIRSGDLDKVFYDPRPLLKSKPLYKKLTGMDQVWAYKEGLSDAGADFMEVSEEVFTKLICMTPEDYCLMLLSGILDYTTMYASKSITKRAELLFALLNDMKDGVV